MDALLAWFAQLEFGPLLDLLTVGFAALVCISFHEVCHGLAALALGDPTAKRMGRLTLNPLKHIDPIGLLMLLTAKVGWAKPVPVDARHFRDPKLGMVLTAIAGPLSNVVLSAVAAVLYTLCMFYGIYLQLPFLDGIATFFYYVFFISVGLAVFNLLPFPPLDGSKVLFSLLPKEWYWRWMRYERYGMFVLVGIMWLGLLDAPLTFLRGGLAQFLAPISGWVLELLTAIHI